MKKLSIILVLTFAMAAGTYAQKSFYTGALVFSANYGIDGNITEQHYAYQEGSNAQTINGMTPASDFSMGGEVGLLNWLGVGLIARVDDYTPENNQLIHSSPSVGAFDFGGIINIHVLRMNHTDILGGVDWGVSQLTYNVNNGTNTTSYGSGNWSDIHATARFYFNKFGFNFTLFAPTVTYNNLQTNNPDVGEYIVNYWKSTGYGASVGLQYRLL
jgi:hypothetical protein